MNPTQNETITKTELHTTLIPSPLEPLVSAQKWIVVNFDGNPKQNGRYLIVYRYKEATELRYYIGDYDICYGWNAMMDNVEILAWRNIPFFNSEALLSR